MNTIRHLPIPGIVVFLIPKSTHNFYSLSHYYYFSTLSKVLDSNEYKRKLSSLSTLASVSKIFKRLNRFKAEFTTMSFIDPSSGSEKENSKKLTDALNEHTNPTSSDVDGSRYSSDSYDRSQNSTAITDTTDFSTELAGESDGFEVESEYEVPPPTATAEGEEEGEDEYQYQHGGQLINKKSVQLEGLANDHSEGELSGNYRASQQDSIGVGVSGIILSAGSTAESSETCLVDKCVKYPDWVVQDSDTKMCQFVRKNKAKAKGYYSDDTSSEGTEQSEEETCNAYCEWMKTEWELPGPVYDDKDTKLSLRRIGEKYFSKFHKIRCVLIDLSGTVHVGSNYVEGGIEAIQLLKKYGINYRFCTNTTKESKNCLLEKLRRFGFDVEPDEICTSLTAARAFIDKHELRPLFLIEKEAMEDFEGVSEENPNSVCIGLSPTNFNYEMLNKAMRLINLGAPWIGIHQGRYFEDADGYLSMGPGPFIQSLRFATATKPTICGKPERRFFEQVIAPFDCDLSETVMIGDDVRDDVGGPIKHKMKGILVRTGKFREGDEHKIYPLKAHMLAANLYTAVKAVVGAICLQRNIRTGETSEDETDEDETNEMLERKKFLKRVQDHVAFSECPRTTNRCTLDKFMDQPRHPPRQFKDLYELENAPEGSQTTREFPEDPSTSKVPEGRPIRKVRGGPPTDKK